MRKILKHLGTKAAKWLIRNTFHAGDTMLNLAHASHMIKVQLIKDQIGIVCCAQSARAQGLWPDPHCLRMHAPIKTRKL